MGETRGDVSLFVHKTHRELLSNVSPLGVACECGWMAEGVETRAGFRNQHREHQRKLIEEMREDLFPRKPIEPDPISMSSDVYIRALILKNHRPSQFGCSCGVMMASGDCRRAIFDFHVDGLLERTLDVIAKEIGGDCRG